MLERYVLVRDAAQMHMVYDLMRPVERALFPWPSRLHAMDKEPVGEDAKRVPSLDLWASCQERMLAETIGWHPGKPRYWQDEDDAWHINEFVSPSWRQATPGTGSCDRLVEHINWLCPIEREREWLWVWIARLILRPGVRQGVAPLFIATSQGTGRGALFTALTELLHMSNVQRPTITSILKSQFNGFLHRNLLCIVDEVHTEVSLRFSLPERLNALVTERHLQIEHKGVDSGMQHIYSNLILASNKPDALHLSTDDRRIQVLTNPQEPHEGEDYYHNLNCEVLGCGIGMEPTREQTVQVAHNMRAFVEHLRTIDISQARCKELEMHRAWIDAPAKKLLLESAKSMTHQALDIVLASPPEIAMTYKHLKQATEVVMRENGWGDLGSTLVHDREFQHLVRTDKRLVAIQRNGTDKFKVGGATARVYSTHGKAGSAELALAAVRRLEDKLEKGEDLGFSSSVTPIKGA